MELKQFKKYQATLKLQGLVETMASNGMVADKLKAVGFVNVTVTGSGAERTAVGIWSKPTQMLPPLPEQVIDVKEL